MVLGHSVNLPFLRSLSMSVLPTLAQTVKKVRLGLVRLTLKEHTKMTS
jgi:hypothetical protein